MKNIKKILQDAQKDNEPVFVIRAKDKFSTNAIYTYIGKCIDHCDLSHTREIIHIAGEFMIWQMEHPDKVKIPD